MVSIGNQLFHAIERDDHIFYINEADVPHLWNEKECNVEALLNLSTYAFEVIKAPHGWTHEHMTIKSSGRVLQNIKYDFKPMDVPSVG
ncbi:MAG: hypothetical protein HOH07_03475 [Euryarchaeota archaeon]|jgi:hypothetical protein|nr:hypothetical protein [Euryarchaeota archaeon]